MQKISAERKVINMKLQQILSLTRKAVDDYELIKSGDRIAIGISGGKDSLTLLYALANLRRFYPEKFELEGIFVNLGLEPAINPKEIQALCESLKVPFHMVETEIGKIIFEERKEKNPCSLCAKLRKGAFNKKAKELDCNKTALGHHKDDFIETALLSLLFEGHFYVFPPKTYLDKMDLTVIRPLLYLDEKDVIGFRNKYALPVQKNPCPADGYTKREYAKNLLQSINREHPGAKDRIFHAIINGGIPGWNKVL